MGTFLAEINGKFNFDFGHHYCPYYILTVFFMINVNTGMCCLDYPDYSTVTDQHTIKLENPNSRLVHACTTLH